MTWVRRAAPASVRHECALPTGASLKDLWRCDGCSKLWRLADACDACDAYGQHWSHGGQCFVGTTWRKAKLRQRLRYWKTTSTPIRGGDVD